MSKVLEVVFVIGCSVVGFGMSFRDGSLFQNSVNTSIQLIHHVESNAVSHANRVGAHLNVIHTLMQAVHR